MKKTLLTFMLTVMGLASMSAQEEYTGVHITNGMANMYYLFQEKPIVKFQQDGRENGIVSACLYAQGNTHPVVSLPLHQGLKLVIDYDTWAVVHLNEDGYATFSDEKDVFIANNGVRAYKASVDDETITLSALQGNIPAGNGVMLYSKTANTVVYLPTATAGQAADMTGNDLKATTLADGSLAPLESNSWALGEGNEFLLYTGAAYAPNRAYLVHEAPAEAMRIVFDDETTGIRSMGTGNRDGKYLEKGKIVIVKNGVKYNVSGQVIK